ncbi:MAG: nuclease-related domain-containing protein, partial [Eubacterium sp.]
ILGLFILMALTAILIGAKRFSNKRARNYAGQCGEEAIATLLKRSARFKLCVLTNLYLPHHDKTTEIDLLLIMRKGIFVIESKNYSGAVYGDEKQKNWLKIAPSGGRLYFYNPIWQNNTHLKALKKQLPEIDERHFYSYIVFGEKTILKKVKIRTKKIRVIHLSALKGTIKKEIWWRRKVLSKKEIESIEKRLLPYCSRRFKKQHVHGIKRIQK